MNKRQRKKYVAKYPHRFPPYSMEAIFMPATWDSPLYATALGLPYKVIGYKKIRKLLKVKPLGRMRG